MPQPSQKVAKFNVERSFTKPSSSICKSLFDSSDPLETKRMVEAMIISESNRMKEHWDFDCRSKNLPENKPLKSGSFEKPPMTFNRRRYEWTLQDREKVPHFYTRPYHFHKSESTKLDNYQTASIKDSLQSKNALSPLSSRDQNTKLRKREMLKRHSNKRVPHFTSPPKITSGDLNPSLVRFVTALRVPLSFTPQQIHPPSSTNPETPSNEDATPLSCGTSKVFLTSQCNKTVKEFNPAISSSSMTSQTPASEPTKKRSSQEAFGTQPKITDVIPQRKFRQNSTKRRSFPNHEQPPTSTSH